MSSDFTPAQKRYLEGFASGLTAARAARGQLPAGVTAQGEPAQSPDRVNTLNVFNDGGLAGYIGHLGSISSQEFSSIVSLYDSAEGATFSQSMFGELDGMGMGGAVTLNGSDTLAFSGNQTLGGSGTVTLNDVDNITDSGAGNTLTIAIHST